MALRIWCNPKYFPPETHASAVAAAIVKLAARGVTLEQVAEVQVRMDQAIDFPHIEQPPAPLAQEWDDAWFAAIDAAKVAAGVQRAAIGAMLVLDDTDDRFGPAPASSQLK